MTDDVVRRYHDATRHTPANIGGTLDWSRKPESGKAYPDAPRVALPDDSGGQVVSLADLSRRIGSIFAPRDAAIPSAAIGGTLRSSYGETLVRNYGGERVAFRAAPSAGALFPNELYLVAHRVDGLDPGVYHYHVAANALERIEDGDVWPYLIANCLAPPALARAAAAFLITGVPARSGWKYRTRAYRYVCLDGGHLAANLQLVAAGRGLASHLLLNFYDDAVNNLLNLDVRREYVLAVVPVGLPSEEPMDTHAVAAGPVDPAWGGDLVGEVHHTGALVASPPSGRPLHFEFRASPAIDLPDEVLHPERVLMRRRSLRDFTGQTLSRADLRSLLALESAFFAGTFTDVRRLVDVHAVVHNVEGLAPGLYTLTEDGDVDLVQTGHLTAPLARASLGQEFIRSSAVQFLYAADLRQVYARFGARAYRELLIQAGVSGEAFYAGASWKGLGACGIGAFFDDEAAAVTGLAPRDRSLLYYVAVGRA
jgi:SagB-type dehydrogenase family enzyme